MKNEMLHTIQPLLALLIGILISLFLIPKIIRKAKASNNLDIPNWRSSHNQPVPSSGGISFNASILMCLTLFISSNQTFSLILCLISIGVLGYVDDLKNLKSKFKFIFQFFIAFIVYWIGFKIQNLHGLLGIYELNDSLSLILTLIFIVGVTNAYNLIDGVDGLAGSISTISLLTFAVIFFLSENLEFLILSLSILGSILGFLKFNFSPAKIFMGDSGSLVIGLILAVFSIQVLSEGNTSNIAVSISTLMIPCIDMTRLFVIRLAKGTSPFKADKNHYHHLLIKAGDSHKKVTMTAIIVSLLVQSITMTLSCFYSIHSTIFIALLLYSSTYIWIEHRQYCLSKLKNQNLQNSMLTLIKDNKLLNKKI